MSILSKILEHKKQQRPLLAVLVDPDKQEAYQSILPYINDVDLIFIGGSTGESIDPCIKTLRQNSLSPLILFPGNIAQFSPNADALLFLSLLNAQTADLLTKPHIKVATQVLQSGIETIPMGYILLDGERKSSVEIVSKCTPIPQKNIEQVLATAIAAQLLGKQLIYLEAGSGAKKSVSIDIIQTVREHISIPLIVGGGICNTEAMLQAFHAGADIVVIGNHFEQHPSDLPIFINALKNYAT
jgi:putative glycerol-1-phosphate prenyltransferase